MIYFRFVDKIFMNKGLGLILESHIGYYRLKLVNDYTTDFIRTTTYNRWCLLFTAQPLGHRPYLILNLFNRSHNTLWPRPWPLY